MGGVGDSLSDACYTTVAVRGRGQWVGCINYAGRHRRQTRGDNHTCVGIIHRVCDIINLKISSLPRPSGPLIIIIIIRYDKMFVVVGFSGKKWPRQTLFPATGFMTSSDGRRNL